MKNKGICIFRYTENKDKMPEKYKKEFAGIGNLYKQLKAVSRQPLTNFVNLKSNTIMKKPRCKGNALSIFCQAFFG
ncbi:hypothetical protein [Parabacteroides pacaensis]|uniref:hypothetical protein n=1 Tax=Parabacteroides pacaensis TaxID=2086575 RepID=UPI00131BB055|nr:hypothetical protein [Parabacteroides pacaensis]